MEHLRILYKWQGESQQWGCGENLGSPLQKSWWLLRVAESKGVQKPKRWSYEGREAFEPDSLPPWRGEQAPSLLAACVSWLSRVRELSLSLPFQQAALGRKGSSSSCTCSEAGASTLSFTTAACFRRLAGMLPALDEKGKQNWWQF